MTRPLTLWLAPVSNLAGVARHIIDVARVGLPGWRLVVAAPEGPLLDELRALGCPVVPFEVDQPVNRAVADLRDIVGKLSPTIVHSHLAKADFLSAMATVGMPVTLVSTEHHIPEDPSALHSSRTKAVTRQMAHHARIRRFTHLLAVSDSTKRDMLRYWKPSVPITVVKNGVDRPDAVLERRPGLRLLSLTRLDREKNLEMTLRVFAGVLAKHPEATLTIGGTGPLENELRACARKLGVDHATTFAGFIDANRAMAEHDVLLQPSRADNLSYTLLDAVAAGMGVVASNIGGNPEILPGHALASLDDDTAMVDAVVEQGLDLSRRPCLPESIPTVREMAGQVLQVYAGLQSKKLPSDPPPGGRRIALLSNQGEIGGGEVMLLAIAEAARELGHDVTVAAPATPSKVADTARAAGFVVEPIRGEGARSYAQNLRSWARQHDANLLWCNGLRPAFATAGLPRRVVHLHQLPAGKTALAARAARHGALATIVPSHFVAERLPGSKVLENWVAPVEVVRTTPPRVPRVIGYLGRLSDDKGVGVLAEAVEKVIADGHDVRLLVAGEARFVDGATAARIEASLNRLGDRVERRGWMDRATFFSEVDLAVFPSVWEETFGLVAAEAMAARCPFVVSDAGALPEVVGADYPFVARAGNPDALADALVRALGTDGTSVTESSYVRWSERYSPEAGRTRLSVLLDSVLVEVQRS